MFGNKVFSVGLIAIYLTDFVLCDISKNNSWVPFFGSRDEQIKNEFDHFHIQYHNISTITPHLLRRLSSLKKLEIEFCNITSIEEYSFSTLQNLRKLSLKHNL